MSDPTRSRYECIARLLQWVVAETDDLIRQTDGDPQEASAIAREVYRLVGNCGQEVMERCLIDRRTLEERLGWKETHATARD